VIVDVRTLIFDSQCLLERVPPHVKTRAATIELAKNYFLRALFQPWVCRKERGGPPERLRGVFPDTPRNILYKGPVTLGRTFSRKLLLDHPIGLVLLHPAPKENIKFLFLQRPMPCSENNLFTRFTDPMDLRKTPLRALARYAKTGGGPTLSHEKTATVRRERWMPTQILLAEI